MNAPLQPAVTIITTVYDRVADLRRCLASVARSTFVDLEQIVAVDHPPQEVTVQLADVVAQAVDTAPYPLRFLALPARTNNWGIGPAEAALTIARGKYVAFLSDDNAYLPDHLAPLVAALERDPELGFVYSSCLYAHRMVLRQAPPRAARIDLGQPLFRRSTLARVLGDPIKVPHQVMAWDWHLIAALLEAGVRWQHVDRATFVFRAARYPELIREHAWA